MGYKFSGSYGEYRPNRVIQRLGDFILANPGFLQIIKQICEVVDPNCKDEGANRELVASVLFQAHEVLFVDRNEEFAELLGDFVAQDVRDSGNTRGKLFEYLIYKKGPFSFKSTRGMEVIRCAKILRNDGTPLGGASNFDFCFLIRFQSKGRITDLEMLECKLDLATCLGETSRCVKKLEYMKIISQCGICSCYSVGLRLFLIVPPILELASTHGVMIN